MRTGGFVLTFSQGHIVYANGELKSVCVTEGDVVDTLDGRTVVIGMVEGLEERLFAPKTLDGNMLVDGVSALCYTTALKLAVAQYLRAVLTDMVKMRVGEVEIRSKF